MSRPRINIYLKDGRIVDFESSSFKISTKEGTANNPHGAITSLEWNKADKGVSLLYINPTEIAAITRDTGDAE